MKKLILFLTVFIFSFNSVFAIETPVYPTYKGENQNSHEITERIHIVVQNVGSNNDSLILNAMTVASIAENAEVYLYPQNGYSAPIKVETTKAGVQKLEKALEVVPSQSSVNVFETALLELLSSDKSSRKLIQLKNSDDWSSLFDSTYHKKYPELFIAYALVSGNGQGIYYTPYNSEANAFSYIREMMLSSYGYEKCRYANYSKRDGLISIEAGKADKNIFVYAYSKKSDYLYLSGYLTTKTNYDKNIDKKSISGVSLSYNHINIKKATEPKNVVMALYSIDDSVSDTSVESFVIPLKNAENYEVYYRSEMGSGVCTKSTTYDKSQDNAVKNFDAPQPVKTTSKATESSSEIESIFERATSSEKEESSSGFMDVVKKIFSVILNIILLIIRLIWLIVRVGFIAFVILLIINKKFRNFIHMKILASRFAPQFERIYDKVMTNIKNVQTATVKIKGTVTNSDKFVFISHSSGDMKVPNNRIELIVRALEQKGVSCWLAENSIKPGQDYNTVLPNAIENCSLFLLFLSPAACASEEVLTEVSTAKRFHKMIVPVQITDFEPLKIQKWEYILSTSQITTLFKNDSAKINELATYIEEELKGKK